MAYDPRDHSTWHPTVPINRSDNKDIIVEEIKQQGLIGTTFPRGRGRTGIFVTFDYGIGRFEGDAPVDRIGINTRYYDIALDGDLLNFDVSIAHAGGTGDSVRGWVASADGARQPPAAKDSRTRRARAS